MRRRFVYFIKPIGMDGPIKIGCSVSPDNRRASLQYWSPFPLEVIAEIDGDYQLERRFHARFEHLFISHEWFRPAPELVETIEAVASGSFDIASLPTPKVLHNTETGARKPWTEEQRKGASLTHRCRWMKERSGYYFASRENLGATDSEVAAKVEAYLAAPHLHGTPCTWGSDLRKQWLANLSPESAAA